jgi:hypothetical protein
MVVIEAIMAVGEAEMVLAAFQLEFALMSSSTPAIE